MSNSVEKRIATIKNSADARSIFRRFWPDHYREHGNCQCPFHDDKTPSLQLTKEGAHCHSGCGFRDVLDLYQAGAGVDLKQALEDLETEFGLDGPTSVRTDRLEGTGGASNGWTGYACPISMAGVEYLKSRAIIECIPRLTGLVGSSPAGKNNTGRDAIAFVVSSFDGSEKLGAQFIPVGGSGKKFAKGTKAGEAFFRLKGNEPTIITEGILDALSVAEAMPGADVCAILSASSTDKLKQIIGSPQAPIIFLDGDHAGQKATAEAINILNGQCLVVDWSLAPTGCKDPNDLLRQGHRDIIKEMVQNAEAAPLHEESVSTASKPTRKVFSAADLKGMVFPEPVWLVPHIAPHGTTLLAGKPKIGKSYLALSLAISLAAGGKALGKIEVEKQGVLYLCLEDRQRRLQDRIAALDTEGSWSENLHLVTEWPRTDQGGLTELRNFLSAHPDVKLVIIDTFAKIKGGQGRSKNSYDLDYAEISGLKSVADGLGISILLVHHLRKLQAQDPFDEISGSTGLTGAVDTAMVLKNDRGRATLYIRGRDVEEQELALEREPTGGWKLVGPADSVDVSEERHKILQVLKDHDSPISTGDIAKTVGKTVQNVSNLLSKLVKDGLVKKIKYGKYIINVSSESSVTDVSGVSSVSPKASNIDNRLTSTTPAYVNPECKLEPLSIRDKCELTPLTSDTLQTTDISPSSIPDKLDEPGEEGII